NQIRSGKAPGFPYEQFNRASKEEKITIFWDYAEPKLKADPAFQKAQADLMRATPVVQVVLDLGGVLLRRAQALADPEARKAELEKAEKTFLDVRGLAGQTPQFRLHLGQVKYWLGKHGDGRKLLDEYLEAQQRETDSLLAVSNLLREVGLTPDAR